jgi:hypothetical protein
MREAMNVFNRKFKGRCGREKFVYGGKRYYVQFRVSADQISL